MSTTERDWPRGSSPRWRRGPILALVLCLAASPAAADFHAALTNVDIDGHGASAAVDPGQSFTLSADYTVWNDASCPACIVEIVMAIERDGQACLYEGIPPLEPGTSGRGSVQMTAPSTPGIYSVRFGLELQLWCDLAIATYESRPDPGAAVATIVVSGMESQVENVDIAGQGVQANIAPGATFPVDLDYSVTNPSNCPACIAQLVIGVESDGQSCAYNAIPPLFPGDAGHATVTLTAPTAPGTYSIRYTHELQLSCAAAIARYETNPPAGNVIGTITVGGFHAWVTGCNIDGQGSHAAVPPSGTCNVSLDYTVWSSVDCPACIDEIVIGIEEDGQVCAYIGIPGVAPGVSGSATVQLTVPASSGTYSIRYALQAQMTCDLAIARFEAEPPAGNVIGTLEVAVPGEATSWGSIKARYEN